MKRVKNKVKENFKPSSTPEYVSTTHPLKKTEEEKKFYLQA